MLKNLLPKERRFFEYFQQQATVIQRGLDLFEELLRDYDRREELTKQIKDVENQADDVAHKIFSLLNNVFVTPFDREDIQLLAHRMDDVIDLLEKASTRMVIYALPVLPDSVQGMLVILRKAFDKLAHAVGMLNNPKHREDIFEICIEVNRLENEGDALLRESLRRLFKDGADALHVVKMKDIYESLEDAIDRCEDIANVLETILIKNA
jgi:predicted phosphate transport protein (TIGR00153 family)